MAVSYSFGPDVRALVEAVTDDKSLPKATRKQAQIDRAPGKPLRAKLLKIADKTTRLALKDVAATVTRAQSGKPAGASAVVISADRSVRYESVVKVMDTLQRAGVQRVGLSVQLAK